MSKSLYTVIVSLDTKDKVLARTRGEDLAREWSRIESLCPGEISAWGSGPGYLIVRTDLLPYSNTPMTEAIRFAQSLPFAMKEHQYEEMQTRFREALS